MSGKSPDNRLNKNEHLTPPMPIIVQDIPGAVNGRQALFTKRVIGDKAVSFKQQYSQTNPQFKQSSLLNSAL
ncbi:hypothetical protein D3C81_2205470 [compost metagenome]